MTQVVTVYDMIPELFAGSEYFTATHLAKREYVETCELVICISESTRRDMIDVYGSAARRTVVVPLAVDPGFRPGLPRLPNLPERYLLYVGKRDGYKDFSLLPQALEYLRDVGLEIPLVVVGPPFNSREIQDLRERRLTESVARMSLDDVRLRKAYSNCTILVQTSRYEGFGLTPLEGMASGVPVVVANASSMPEVCGDVAGYFQPGDAQGLANAMLPWLLDSDTRRSAGQRGLSRASEFSVANMAMRTAEAYRALLRGDE